MSKWILYKLSVKPDDTLRSVETETMRIYQSGYVANGAWILHKSASDFPESICFRELWVNIRFREEIPKSWSPLMILSLAY